MRNVKQAEEVLVEKVVKTTIQTLHDKVLVDNYDNAEEVLKHYLLHNEVNKRRRFDFDELKDDNIVIK